MGSLTFHYILDHRKTLLTVEREAKKEQMVAKKLAEENLEREKSKHKQEMKKVKEAAEIKSRELLKTERIQLNKVSFSVDVLRLHM